MHCNRAFRRLRRSVVALTPLLLVSGCRIVRVPPAQARAQALADTAAFHVSYDPAPPLYREFRQGLIANRFLDTVAKRLNDSLRLPRSITIATANCDQPNATYDPDTRRVILCYELFKSLADEFPDDDSATYLITGTIMFALMHEVGHALVDVLDLPITGREEVAVDQLATMLLLQQGAAGDSLAFGAVGWFATTNQLGDFDSLALADVHPVNLQRVYNLLCWIYGSDPARYPQIFSDSLLPDDRRDQCPAEYRRMADSWKRLLAPYHRGP
jgi:Putative metallopeptidase